MPTNPLAAVAFALGATFLLGMLVGVVLMLGSATLRRRGTAVAARLLLSGPAGGLFAAALYVATLDPFPVVLRVLMIAMFLVTATPVFVWVLRTKVTFAPIGRAQS